MVDVGELFVTLVDNSFNKEFLLWNDVEEYSCESCSRSSLANILENIGDELLSIERKLNEVKVSAFIYIFWSETNRIIIFLDFSV